MPDPWFYEDVRYDWQTSQDAFLELTLAAESLAEALGLVEADVPLVVDEWSGHARIAFDEDMRELIETGHQVVALLLGAATAVQTAEHAAYEESRVRSELRTAHEAELAAAEQAELATAEG
jgi:hypothetical protein